jgi:DNA-binding SARP family transcriptional activator
MEAFARSTRTFVRAPSAVVRYGAPAPAAREQSSLQIATLGATRILRDREEIGGPWLEQRAGQLFKLLLARRGAVVRVDEIIEDLWPEAGLQALPCVRVTVHALREVLDPRRCPRGVGSFVVSHRGGYRLDADRVVVDVDRFDDLVELGLRAAAGGEVDAAAAYLEEAMNLYEGPYLVEDLYADWTIAERERLQGLAAQALEELAELAERDGDLPSAARWLDRLAVLEPYDERLQRRLLTLCLRRGRRSEAMRRYAVLTARLRRDLGEEPSFGLATLLAELRA